MIGFPKSLTTAQLDVAMLRCNGVILVQQMAAFCLWSIGDANAAGGIEGLRRKLRRRGRGGLEGVSAQVSAHRVPRCMVAPAVFGVEESGVATTLGYACT